MINNINQRYDITLGIYFMCKSLVFKPFKASKTCMLLLLKTVKFYILFIGRQYFMSLHLLGLRCRLYPELLAQYYQICMLI